MSVRRDVTPRLAQEMRDLIGQADSLLDQMRQAMRPPGPSAAAAGQTGLSGILARGPGPGHGTVDDLDALLTVLLILREVRSQRDPKASPAASETELAAQLLQPLLGIATPALLRAAQDHLETQLGAKVSFVSVCAEDLLGGDPHLAAAQAGIAQDAILATRRRLLSLGRSGKPVLAMEAALALARGSARAEFEDRLEDPEEDEDPPA